MTIRRTRWYLRVHCERCDLALGIKKGGKQGNEKHLLSLARMMGWKDGLCDVHAKQDERLRSTSVST